MQFHGFKNTASWEHWKVQDIWYCFLKEFHHYFITIINFIVRYCYDYYCCYVVSSTVIIIVVVLQLL